MRRCHSVQVMCLVGAIATPLFATGRQTIADETTIVTRFEVAVQQYMDLRRQVTGSLPSLDSSTDVAEIRSAIRARADALRAARPKARAGELFTPEVAALFRQRILAALNAYDVSESDVLREGDEGLDGETVPAVVVNESFPWERAPRMLACVLASLPLLPAGLEYRFVATSLVLVDVEATLVVDVMDDALRISLAA
jgi:hypothetical protein